MKKKGNYFVSYLAVDMNDGKFKVYGRGDVVTDAVIDDLKRTISRANAIPVDDIWVVAFNKV